jgi:hypothetical protein
MAGQNAKTGFVNPRTGVGALMEGGGHTLAERFGRPSATASACAAPQALATS